MRMFLVGMADIFLMLYLTAITSVRPGTVLTVEDFYRLNEMHQSLEQEKRQAEAALRDELSRAQEEKQQLAARLETQQGHVSEITQTLAKTLTERERIDQDLKIKEEMLRAREELLVELNQQIAEKEKIWQDQQEAYRQQLESQKITVAAARQRARELEAEAIDAQRLADQMQQEADQAYQIASVAEAVKDRAVQSKEEALKEKQEAERLAAEAQAAREAAEARRQEALVAAADARAQKRVVERKARMLAATIDEIKQDGATAFEEHIRPQLQTLNVTWKREIAGDETVYERALTLLPVMIDGKRLVIFPSRQIGFTGRSDKAPQALRVKFGQERIRSGWIDEENDLLALVLPGYDGPAEEPHPAATPVGDLMPTLLSLRNNGNVGLVDKLRGISDDYFIVNRDYIEPGGGRVLRFILTGFRGTGLRAERVVRGDQLVDLNGRLIGVADNPNHLIRPDSLEGWSEIAF